MWTASTVNIKHSDAKVPFHIKVVDTDEVNAFAFRRLFFVNKGPDSCWRTKRNWLSMAKFPYTARHVETAVRLSIFSSAIPPLSSADIGQMGIQNALGLGINLELMGITRVRAGSRYQPGFNISEY